LWTTIRWRERGVEPRAGRGASVPTVGTRLTDTTFSSDATKDLRLAYSPVYTRGRPFGVSDGRQE